MAKAMPASRNHSISGCVVRDYEAFIGGNKAKKTNDSHRWVKARLIIRQGATKDGIFIVQIIRNGDDKPFKLETSLWNIKCMIEQFERL